MDPARAGAVVLAAGRARRFGSDKLLASLDGRPVLQHVLDTLVGVGIRHVAVVLGAHAARQEAVLAWRGERRVRNPDPARGLSSSLRIGLAELAAATASGAPLIDAALICLGDQPRLDPDVILRLLAASDRTEPMIVPRYAHGGGGNPVLLRRSAWTVADTIEGDEGLRSVIATSPDLVGFVDVPGSNPDVDTPADLQRLSRGEA